MREIRPAKIVKISEAGIPLADVFSPKPHIAGRSPCHNVQTGNVKGSPQVRIYAVAKRQKKVECAIFRRGIPHPVSGIAHYADNAPGRASEATSTIPAPKYRKNGASVFQRHICTVFRQFPAGKTKTSDFSGTNIRGFASKVRRFVAKKSDVSDAFSHLFRLFFAVFCRFQRQKCPETMVSGYSTPLRFDIQTLQNVTILPFFRAGRDAGHCQNF